MFTLAELEAALPISTDIAALAGIALDAMTAIESGSTNRNDYNITMADLWEAEERRRKYTKHRI